MYYFELKDLNSHLIDIIGEERYNFLFSKKADKVLILIDGGIQLADVGLYYSNIPKIDNKSVGYIGVIHNIADTLSKNDLNALINFAEMCLSNHKVKTIITPIDRDTWSEYRCKTYTQLTTPFFGEPQENYFTIFNSLNYKKNYKYFSILSNNENKIESNFENIKFRLVTQKTLLKDIEKIYELSTNEFKDNLFYGDISKEQFIDQYTKLFYSLSPVILVAEYNDEIIGFMLGYNGVNCLDNEKTFIMKTIAIKSDFRGSGLGTELYKRVANIAYKNGFSKLIGALIHEDNVSYKITKKYSPIVISEYALFTKEVTNGSI